MYICQHQDAAVLQRRDLHRLQSEHSRRHRCGLSPDPDPGRAPLPPPPPRPCPPHPALAANSPPRCRRGGLALPRPRAAQHTLQAPHCPARPTRPTRPARPAPSTEPPRLPAVAEPLLCALAMAASRCSPSSWVLARTCTRTHRTLSMATGEAAPPPLTPASLAPPHPRPAPPPRSSSPCLALPRPTSHRLAHPLTTSHRLAPRGWVGGSLSDHATPHHTPHATHFTPPPPPCGRWVAIWFCTFCFDQLYIKHVVDSVAVRSNWGWN